MDCKSCSGKGCEKCMSEGGEVKGVHKSSMDIDRPHSKKEKKWAGESKAGEHSRRFADFKPSFSSKLNREEAIDSHHKVLGEMTVMPKPKLKGLAKGGMPEDAPNMDDSGSSELLESCAQELISAIHSKNKKEILDSLKAIILSTKG